MAYTTITDQAYCKQCAQLRKITRQQHRTSHLMHLLLSIVTFGIWLPVWLMAILNFEIRADRFSGFRCDTCGGKQLYRDAQSAERSTTAAVTTWILLRLFGRKKHATQK